MSFLERLYLLMKDRDIKKNALCKTLEINGNSFVNWENRGTLPSAEILIKLANYFGVTSDYLLGLDDVPNRNIQLSEDKWRLLKMYDLLSDMEKGEILGELKMLTRDTPMVAAARSTDNSIPTKPNIDNLDDIPTMDEE